MMGLETINAVNAENAAVARERGINSSLTRLTAKTLSRVSKARHIGDAADDVDKVRERIDTLFCDASGWGSPNEPALTQDQLFERLEEICKEHGKVDVAITEAGQFQLYLGVWAV